MTDEQRADQILELAEAGETEAARAMLLMALREARVSAYRKSIAVVDYEGTRANNPAFWCVLGQIRKSIQWNADEAEKGTENG